LTGDSGDIGLKFAPAETGLKAQRERLNSLRRPLAPAEAATNVKARIVFINSACSLDAWPEKETHQIIRLTKPAKPREQQRKTPVPP
jgi:hypothetical protein